MSEEYEVPADLDSMMRIVFGFTDHAPGLNFDEPTPGSNLDEPIVVNTPPESWRFMRRATWH